MITSVESKEPSIRLMDSGDWGSFPRLAFALIRLSAGAHAHELVSAALAGLLAIFTSQLQVIHSYLDSDAMDSKGFRRRKLRKPPDKTINRITGAHARPQKQLNNLILRRTNSFQKRM